MTFHETGPKCQGQQEFMDMLFELVRRYENRFYGIACGEDNGIPVYRIKRNRDNAAIVLEIMAKTVDESWEWAVYTFDPYGNRVCRGIFSDEHELIEKVDKILERGR